MWTGPTYICDGRGIAGSGLGRREQKGLVWADRLLGVGIRTSADHDGAPLGTPIARGRRPTVLLFAGGQVARRRQAKL